MKYDAKMLIKLSLIFLGLLFLVCVWLGRRTPGKEVPGGEKITIQDVRILLEALDVHISGQIWESGMEGADGEDMPYLTYGQYIAICREMVREQPALDFPDYSARYEPVYKMQKSDWYEAYRLMLAYFDTDSSIWETDVFLLGIDEAEKEAYTEGTSMQSPYQYESEEFGQNVLRKIRVYVKGSRLLTVVETFPEEYTLENVWVMESEGGLMECFYHDTVFQAEAKNPAGRERIVDLTFRDGYVSRAKEKNQKVHGKLLWVSADELEIEGSGVYPIEEGMEVYKLYGSLEALGRADLRIGYSDTDYVIEKGRVCACLVSEKEAADRIRVLLKNTAKGNNYYDVVELTVDGETVRIEADDLKVGERRTYRCAALTDKLLLNIEGITKADNAYRGTIECYRNEEGMVLINELPLEEYLYAVVPSEMPASYPLEALKAQAVCARTYAYRYILHAALPALGAHLDDTTSYQVYHNVAENAATTTAVKETDGMLLTDQGEPAQNYYYSTSSGAGTDATIWKSGGGNDIPYIQAVRLNAEEYLAVCGEESGVDFGSAEDAAIQAKHTKSTEFAGEAENREREGDLVTVDDLRDEDRFREFIMSTGVTDFEKEEPWYRWTYTVEKIDRDIMLARLKERYASSPEAVLTKTEGDYFVSQPIEGLGKIREISIVQRGAGGVADELLIETDRETYKVLAEYNIRAVLCDGTSEAVKQDGSTVVLSALLPSGFFVVETGKSEDNVIGYTLTGGGYGHGVGMSQNGARALGRAGASCRQILEFFFRGCELDFMNQDQVGYEDNI